MLRPHKKNSNIFSPVNIGTHKKPDVVITFSQKTGLGNLTCLTGRKKSAWETWPVSRAEKKNRLGKLVILMRARTGRGLSGAGAVGVGTE
jgi:hypothetical protein